jgi:hypothetical protein
MLTQMQKSGFRKTDVPVSQSTEYCPCEIVILQEWWDNNGQQDTKENLDYIFNTLHPKDENAYAFQ